MKGLVMRGCGADGNKSLAQGDSQYGAGNRFSASLSLLMQDNGPVRSLRVFCVSCVLFEEEPVGNF